MGTKICTKCGKKKELSEFSFCCNRNNFRSKCKQCYQEYNERYRQKNKEKIKEKNKIYTFENKRKIKEQKKRYRQKNKEKIKKQKKIRHQKDKENLTSAYIANIFHTSIKNLKQYPPELIELKRIQLKVARVIKNK